MAVRSPAGHVISRRYGTPIKRQLPRRTAAFLGFGLMRWRVAGHKASGPPRRYVPSVANLAALPPFRLAAYLAYLGAQVGGGRIFEHQRRAAAVPAGHSDRGSFWKLNRGVSGN